ncbi:MAG: alpha/beta hydrolase [Proteobacteria bacterium]|nr:alpha/beta hydrolase [Pseudomonadota bacterium]
MTIFTRNAFFLLGALTVAATSFELAAAERLGSRLGNARGEQALDSEDRLGQIQLAQLPQGARWIKDVAYGNDLLQRFDVYAPEKARQSPVIFMVHGGGWVRGDKANRGVVESKVEHWVSHGFVVISVNYRFVPAITPVEEAQDVARALAVAQRDAAQWGGDTSRFILMGHSAGAHLIALINASPDIARQAGAGPWLGSVLLDSGALDVPQIMERQHFDLYDRAFGKDPALWKAASPQDLLSHAPQPMLLVCSSRRRDSCAEAERFVTKAKSLGTRASVLSENMSHGEINSHLGRPSAYTEAVDHFLASLSPDISARLSEHATPAAK